MLVLVMVSVMVLVMVVMLVDRPISGTLHGGQVAFVGPAGLAGHAVLVVAPDNAGKGV